MSEYRAITRAWRPKKFKDVLGQDAVCQTLKNALAREQCSHAYLFCGERGCGKTTLARLLAKALNCENIEDSEPCGQCRSCKEIDGGNSLDVIEIDGASHRGIDDIRQIRDTASYTTHHVKHRIYIIDEVHMLTKEAFNALLKTLEEPPARVKFFLATTEFHKVPITIQSRCQRFRLKRLPIPLISSKLAQILESQNFEYEKAALQLIAQKAEGSMRDAESLLDQVLVFSKDKPTVTSVLSVLGLAPRQFRAELDEALMHYRLDKAFDIAQKIYDEGFDLHQFIDELQEHYRNALLLAAGAGASLLSINEEEAQQYRTLSSKLDKACLLSLLDILEVSAKQIKSSASPRIHLEMTLLKMIRATHKISIDQVLSRLLELEQKLGLPQATPSSESTPTPTNHKAPAPTHTPTPNSTNSTPQTPNPSTSSPTNTSKPAPSTSTPAQRVFASANTPTVTAPASDVLLKSPDPEVSAPIQSSFSHLTTTTTEKKAQTTGQKIKLPKEAPPPSPKPSPAKKEVKTESVSQQELALENNLLQFAAVHLQALIKK